MIAADEKVDDLQHDLEARAIDLLARQQPVATDLRIVVTALRMSADLERLGDLAQHVAKLARLRFPDSAVPHDLHATILEMGQLAQRLMAKAGRGDRRPRTSTCAAAGAGRRRDGPAAPHALPAPAGRQWKHGIETAVDVTLLGRYYERFADHAVSVAKRVVYLVTGEHAEDIGARLGGGRRG